MPRRRGPIRLSGPIARSTRAAPLGINIALLKERFLYHLAAYLKANEGRLRRKIPRDTGQLRKAFYITYYHRTGQLIVGFRKEGFYWFLVAGERSGGQLYNEALRLVRAGAGVALRRALDDVI